MPPGRGGVHARAEPVQVVVDEEAVPEELALVVHALEEREHHRVPGQRHREEHQDAGAQLHLGTSAPRARGIGCACPRDTSRADSCAVADQPARGARSPDSAAVPAAATERQPRSSDAGSTAGQADAEQALGQRGRPRRRRRSAYHQAARCRVVRVELADDRARHRADHRGDERRVGDRLPRDAGSRAASWRARSRSRARARAHDPRHRQRQQRHRQRSRSSANGSRMPHSV